MKQPMRTLILLCLCAWSLASCDKKAQSSPCPDEEAFCNPALSGELSASIPVVNQYLATLPANDPQGLEKLKTWLSCKECVESVDILCESCIQTLPPQSELLIRFEGGTADWKMDILMDDTLRLTGYHE